MGGRSPAELPGAGERGDKGSLRGMKGGERFYSQGRCPSQVFPYKEESAGYSGGWCLRAPCRYLLGPGCRGSVPGSLASLWNLSVAFFRGIPQHARPFREHLSLPPLLFFSFQYLFLFIWLLWVLVAAYGIFDLCHSVQDL